MIQGIFHLSDTVIDALSDNVGVVWFASAAYSMGYFKPSNTAR